jgi:hypothetical protein
MDPPANFVLCTIWNHVFTLCFVARLAPRSKILSLPAGNRVIWCSVHRVIESTLPTTLVTNHLPEILLPDHGDHPITRDHGDYFAPVFPTFFFNLSPT